MMKKTHSMVLALVAATVLGGCSQTLVPMGSPYIKPKEMNGSVDGRLYMSPDGWFSVAMPHEQHTVDFAGMRLEEQTTPDTDSAVSFGPSPCDPNTYHLRVYKKMPRHATLRFSDLAQDARAQMVNEAEAKHNVMLSKYHSEKVTVNGQRALFAVYRQPIRGFASGKLNARTRYHVMYFVDYGDRMAAFWVEKPCRVGDLDGDHGESIKRQEEASIRRFVTSLQWLQHNAPERLSWD